MAADAGAASELNELPKSAMSGDPDCAQPQSTSSNGRRSPLRVTVAWTLSAVIAVAALAGWLGYQYWEVAKLQKQMDILLQGGRQGALNLTSIDYAHVDADIARILDSATGTFHDDFKKRAPAFIEVIKQSQSVSKGSITEAGLESMTGDSGRVLVAVKVTTANITGANNEPRDLRMHIEVQKVGDEVKVSGAGFAS
jgi:Mce-associated membrane protein